MPEKTRDGIQEIVDAYETLAIIVKINKDTAFYETEVYNRGVKMIVGKDILFYMSLARALSGIIRLIDDRKINKHSELDAKEMSKLLEALKEVRNEKVEIFIPSKLEKIIGK